MMSLICEEDASLPTRTLRASCRTALELRSQFCFTRFGLEFDEDLPEDVLRVSSDLYDELQHFLSKHRSSSDRALA